MATPIPEVVKAQAVQAVFSAAQDFQAAVTVDKIQAADVDEIYSAVERVRKAIDVVKVQVVAAQVFAAAEELKTLVSSEDPNDPAAVTVDKIQAAVEKVRLAASNKLPAVVAEDEKSVKQAHRVAANLLSINEDYPLHKSALDDWLQTQKDLFKRVSRRQARSADLTNQIYNIIGWFAVFQGVVLTAVTQLTQTHTDGKPLCGKIWFPIVLTVFGTLVTTIGIIYKFKGLKSLELTIHKEKEAQIEAEKRISTIRSKGPRNFSFSTDVNDDKLASVQKSFWWDSVFVIGALVVYTVLFVLSYFVILCDRWVIR